MEKLLKQLVNFLKKIVKEFNSLSGLKKLLLLIIVIIGLYSFKILESFENGNKTESPPKSPPNSQEAMNNFISKMPEGAKCPDSMCDCEVCPPEVECPEDPQVEILEKNMKEKTEILKKKNEEIKKLKANNKLVDSKNKLLNGKLLITKKALDTYIQNNAPGIISTCGDYFTQLKLTRDKISSGPDNPVSISSEIKKILSPDA